MVEREKSKKKVKLCHHQTTVPSTGIVSVFRTEVKTQMNGMEVLKWVPVSFGYFKDHNRAIDYWAFSFSRSFRRSNVDLFGGCFSISSMFHSFEESGSLFQMGISSGAAEAAAIKLHLDAKLEIYCQSQSLRGNL
ncbi:uncharacterized protein LOC112022606 [Quercus suber]|uniref:uncharacterized protein LOC112022606 n=1 Tax=Quercus suber TaxID=58331 RepID=UPI0032DF754E